MSKIIDYIYDPASRDRLIKNIGIFSVAGSLIVSFILFVAKLLH